MNIEISTYGWWNLGLVFSLGVLYSFVELMNIFKSVRNFFTGWWGFLYVFLNGAISVLALIVTFKSEINQGFLGTKILVAGTSALALLRVVSIPMKVNSTTSNAVPMIEIIFNFIKTSYDRSKSKKDLKDIKPLMKGIDCHKAGEELPLLCGNMLNTLSEEDAKKMVEEIQKFLSLEQGNKELKSVNLGFIMLKYVGFNLLKEAIENTKEYISVDVASEKDDGNKIDSLIEKFK